MINEVKVGFNRPKYDATAFGPAGYDALQVSLSGTVTSQSADARGSTGVARSGLLVRATSNASTNGQLYNPHSISLSDALSMTKGAHSLKFGGEYRKMANSSSSSSAARNSPMRTSMRSSTTIHEQIAVALDSPVFHPQQSYAIGFPGRTPDRRVDNRLTLRTRPPLRLLLGRDERDNMARPLFVEENDFADGCATSASCSAAFYNPDKNNVAPRLSAVFPNHRQDGLARRLRTLLRPRPVRGSHPANRELHRAPPRAGQPARRWPGPYPVDPNSYRNLLSVRGYTHQRPDEYDVTYGTSVSQELPYQVNLTVGYTGSRGKDMFLRGVANKFNDANRVAETRWRARWTTRHLVAWTGSSSPGAKSAAAAGPATMRSS